MTDGELFGSLHHIGIVVNDLDRSVAFYESVGIGPWRDFPSLEPYTHQLSGVEKSELLASRYKYATVGEVQLHLCEPPEGDSPQRRFLSEHGEGVFNLSFSVPDVNDAESRLIGDGLAVLLRGRQAAGTGFTYFDTRPQGAGTVLQVRSSS
jgi:methylmalonyl-CoA/ethylmalonyl-CoA epimerase